MIITLIEKETGAFILITWREGKEFNDFRCLSFYFLNHFAKSLKTPIKVSISSGPMGTNTYINNKKIAVNYKYTNADFWEILDYDFLEGSLSRNNR